jgi:hypothetical protein
MLLRQPLAKPRVAAAPLPMPNREASHVEANHADVAEDVSARPLHRRSLVMASQRSEATDLFDFFLSHKKWHSKWANAPSEVAKSLHDALQGRGFNGFSKFRGKTCVRPVVRAGMFFAWYRSEGTLPPRTSHTTAACRCLYF